MRVFVTGGTGLIGTRLITQLVKRGDDVVNLTRRPGMIRGGATYNAGPCRGRGIGGNFIQIVGNALAYYSSSAICTAFNAAPLMS